MKIITACAKIIKVFSTKIIIICAESLYSNTPEESLSFFTGNIWMNFEFW